MRLLATAFIVTASLLAGGCNLVGSDEPPLGRIVFTKWDAADTLHRTFVYTMNTDGSDLTRLTFPEDRIACDHPHPEQDICGPGRATNPRWSPNGERIAYTESAGPDEGHIIVMNADGSDKRIITPYGGHVDKPRWSPDGERLLYRQYAALGLVVGTFVVDAADGSDKRCISCVHGSPIVFQGDTLSGSHIQWGQTSDLVYLFKYPKPEGGIDFRDPTGIYLLRLSTREVLRKVTDLDLPGRSGSFKIAPDGRKMMYQRGVGGDMRIYLSAPLDAPPEVLTTGSSEGSTYGDTGAEWGNDSRQFVYTKFVKYDSDSGGGKNRIYVADATKKSSGRLVSPVFGRFPDLFVPQ